MIEMASSTRLKDIKEYDSEILDEIADALVRMLIRSINKSSTNKDYYVQIQEIDKVYKLESLSKLIVYDIWGSCNMHIDDECFLFLISLGLNPGYVCSAVCHSYIPLNQKLKRINQLIEHARKNNCFANDTIRDILCSEDYSSDHVVHILEILKFLDGKGISLNINDTTSFEYDGPDIKEIYMLLLKHGTDKDFLLECACYCSENSTKIIKYLINEAGAKWDHETRKESLLDFVSRCGYVSIELLRFLIEDLKIPTNTKDCNNKTPLDNIIEINAHVSNESSCVYYMLSIDAPLTIELKDEDERSMLAFFGKASKNKISFGTLENILVMHLKQVMESICNGKTIGREVFQPDFEPVWNPEQINFYKVPLNYFLDAVYLFWNGSYKESHPYYQKVKDLYGDKKSVVGNEISEDTMREIKSSLKVISTLLQWSPVERQMLGDEAERDLKRIKTSK